MKSVKNAFDLLDDNVLSAVYRQGIIEPTLVQSMAIPLILQGKNLLIISPTGSGKTEAAILPILNMISRERPKPVSLLYVTPLRALNRDMLSRLFEYSRNLGINVQVRHSDINESERREIVRHPGDILITTPESLQIMLVNKNLREIISNIKYLVIDEVHEMAQNERGSQFSIALERLRELNHGFQVIGLSATANNEAELAEFIEPDKKIEIVKPEIRKSVEINVTLPEKASQELSDKMGCDNQYAGSIKRIYNEINNISGGSLVFVNRRYVAEDMSFRIKLMDKNARIEVHHGSLSRESRENAENDFKSGKLKALICTSSLELGIDIGTAELVVQFNSPRQINKLLQRIGRSGHSLEKTSRGLVVCNDVIELEEAMAIVGNALEGKLEDVLIRKNSLATVANQVMLELYFKKKMNYIDFYNLIKRAYPFKDLSIDDYLSVINFLASIKKIIIDGDNIIKRYSILNYYINNISMIPSEKIYRVIDQTNKKFIGTLDEKYVVNEIEPGSYFVMKGSTWRTIRIDEEKILVEPFNTAAIAPHWTGEEIPVLYRAAARVSYNRKNHIIMDFLDDESKKHLIKWYENDLATDDNIIIESQGNEIIIQVLLGTMGNFALAEILTGLLTSITGESVEMDYSPYHIYLRLNRSMNSSQIMDIIKNIDIKNIFGYIKASARRSRFFNTVFLYEARKFGVISNDADISRIRLEKIIESYINTPLYEDSIRKLVFDYMDIDILKKYLENINNVKFTLKNNISESSKTFISHYSERIMPLKPTKVIIDSIKNRLLNEEIILLCTSCGNIRTLKVRNIDSVKCPACGSYLVAAISRFDKEMLSKNDEKTIKRIKKNAHLVKEKGIIAVMAMAARGIGPETASRILEVSYINEDDFIKKIIQAETDFARNRQYWD
ncbi:DEAD/DEAH box helicase [Picrophilus oshimae]|uniref:ATP dependent helicase, Lhr family n=1 Tax=Picrophilus torridus (strain ATCC 700027 / DSM 9790 / JCM 10055 / NBRC 100828 / KAW 2/3) TaxID=1122961 RepID=A0A8G2L879_PICTO|nr:DEAD/DEAH box helicase [Picrophilus oshimae]SMD31154.1 ATP dependent helicase, Lhr family [Picrophilus oshimae DSM 9789]